MSILAKRVGITLREHTEDVIRWTRKLLEHQEKDLQEIGFELPIFRKALFLSAGLHDVGKVHPYFQIVRLRNREYEPFYPYYEVPHSIFSLLFVNEKKLERELGESWKKLVLRSIAFHHWRERFKDYIFRISPELKEFAREDKRELLEELEKCLKEELRSVKLDGDELRSYISINERLIEVIKSGIPLKDYVFPNYLSYLLPKLLELNEEEKRSWMILQGLLIRADHVASYEEENRRPIEEDILEPILYEALRDRVLCRIKLCSKGEIDFWQERFLKRDESIILLAPTGYGKTEFAFLWSAGSRVIYTLPIRTAVNQTFKRAVELFGERRVGLLHSDADVFLLYDNDLSDEVEEALSIKAYEQARLFLRPAIVSTGDQFFPYALRPPSYEKIFSLMPGLKLVVDEVQAYDPVAMAIVVKYAEFVDRMGGKVLIMTATLPHFVMEELISRVSSLTLEKVVDLFKEREDEFKRTRKHWVKVKPVQDESLIGEMLKEVEHQLSFNNRILVIVNTVNIAQQLYDELKSKGFDAEVKLLHSRFTLKDRKDKERELENLLKNVPDRVDGQGKVILIATQVVEASLDIDADVLITVLAPMDSLIQRMGRVLRHVRPGKEFDVDKENVIVFVPVRSRKEFSSSKGRKGKRKSGGSDDELCDRLVTSIYLWVQMCASYKVLKDYEGRGLNEIDKVNMLKRYYKELVELEGKNNGHSSYIEKFYETLRVLDAGYMSNERLEAQKVFRKVMNVNLIPNNLLEDFKHELREWLESEKDVTWREFKENLLSKYLVDLPLYPFVRERWLLLEPVLNKLTDVLEDKAFSLEKRRKLKRYLEHVVVSYMVDVRYDGERGAWYSMSFSEDEGLSVDII